MTVTEAAVPMDNHEAAIANVEENTSSPVPATEPQGPIPSPTAPSSPEPSVWFDPTAVQPEPCECGHIVMPGDTLWSIAQRYTGNAYNYPELAHHSGIRDPRWIYPGDRIRITIHWAHP